MATETDYQSLLSATNVPCYINQPPGIQRVLELSLLQIIANNIGSGGGSGGGVLNGVGNPTSTPSSPTLYLDTSTDNLWAWNGSSWSQLL